MNSKTANNSPIDRFCSSGIHSIEPNIRRTINVCAHYGLCLKRQSILRGPSTSPNSPSGFDGGVGNDGDVLRIFDGGTGMRMSIITSLWWLRLLIKIN